MKKIAWIILLTFVFASCKKGTNERYLIIKYKLSDTMPTYDDSGILVTNADRALASSNGIEGLTPIFNSLSAHEIYLLGDSAPAPIDTLGALYFGEEYFGSMINNDSIGIDYNNAKTYRPEEVAHYIQLSSLKPGVFKYLATEFSYQNISLPIRVDSTVNSFTNAITGVQYPGNTFKGTYNATLAAFTGANTYFKDGFSINNNFWEAKKQFKAKGFYALETQMGAQGINYPAWLGTDKAGRTVAVNHLHKTRPNVVSNVHISPIFSTKYLKNGSFIYQQSPLVITGAETESIVVECVLSTKNYLEWEDNGVRNKQWDPYAGEPIKKIGFRGMIPMIIK